MNFDVLMALLTDCADMEKENMIDKEIADVTVKFINSIVAISKKYGKDANVQLMRALFATMDIAKTSNFNKRKGEEDK